MQQIPHTDTSSMKRISDFRWPFRRHCGEGLFSNGVVADQLHPGVGGPNTWCLGGLTEGNPFTRFGVISGGIWAHFKVFWPLTGPFSASMGRFMAIFSSNVAADRRHPGVEGPNTW